MSRLTLTPQAGGHSAGVASNATLSATDAFANPIAGYLNRSFCFFRSPGTAACRLHFTPRRSGHTAFAMAALKTAGT